LPQHLRLQSINLKFGQDKGVGKANIFQLAMFLSLRERYFGRRPLKCANFSKHVNKSLIGLLHVRMPQPDALAPDRRDAQVVCRLD
jgi:hypothetical protein